MRRGQRGGYQPEAEDHSQKEGQIGSREDAFADVKEDQRVKSVLDEGPCIALPGARQQPQLVLPHSQGTNKAH